MTTANGGIQASASGLLASKQAHSLTRGTQTKWVNYKDWEGETDMQPRLDVFKDTTFLIAKLFLLYMFVCLTPNSLF